MNIDEIYRELAGEFQSRSGRSAGGNSDLAARFYAVAAQLYGLYAQADWTMRQCFPQTAEGEMLDLHGALRGIERHRAEKAAGVVRFLAASERTEAAAIPAGTVCMTAEGRRYLTVEAGVIPLGETALELPVEAAEAGQGWNVAAGRIVYMAVPPAGVIGCTNPEAVTSGQDDETDDALRRRVLSTYSRLANGANAAFYEQEALNYGGVAAVKVLPRSRGVGTVDVVVSAPGGMPDQLLLDGLQDHLQQIREIAVDVAVLAPVEWAVEITAVLTPEEGREFEQVAEAVTLAVESLFTGDLLGRPVLQAELTALIFSVEGVANCAVSVSGGDVPAEETTLPCLGGLTLTEG